MSAVARRSSKPQARSSNLPTRSKGLEMQVKVQEDEKKIGQCGCGRSPTGKCIGWHALSEDEFREQLAQYEDKLVKDNK